jgi:phosphatidylserine/phosphatidylglycerophosphate/cardiolipin synthase-like enzyme
VVGEEEGEVKLIIQPNDGITPLVQAVKRAKKTIDIVIFRFDRAELEKALEAAVARGVVVRALIAHTNRGGEKSLRKLEQRFLEAGVTVARTADDLPRYHGKMMVVDNTLHVFGFNYTKADMEKSRSFGVVVTDKKLVREACTLFEADRTRQAYMPGDDRLVVSPESSRETLTTFIKRARKQLLIYDAAVTDSLILRVLQQRARAGVEIRIIGKVGKKSIAGAVVRKLADFRLHVRAMIRDGSSAFVGSQSLRKLELDGRREIGTIVSDVKTVKRMMEVFEEDWREAGGKPLAVPETHKDKGEKEKERGEKDEKKEEKKEEKEKEAKTA